MSADSKNETIRAMARAAGFDDCRITTPEAPSHGSFVSAWLNAGMNAGMDWLRSRDDLRSGRLDDDRLLAGARSVIVLAASYNAGNPKEPLDSLPGTGIVARYARASEDYHTVLREMLRDLATAIESEFPGIRARGFVDSGPIRERELAARAGLGWQGKHTNLISLDLGNFFFLAALLTTLELPPDAPTAGGHCGTCTRCIAACPTGAIIAPHTLDARRCISYLTIEHRGPIPHELRPLMGNHIFGCDDCLAICPWNDKAQAGRNARLAAATSGTPDLLDLLNLLADDTAFRAHFRGTPLLRPKREGLRRNVCIALGNIGTSDAIAPLAEVAKTDPSETVREAAAWALERIHSRR